MSKKYEVNNIRSIWKHDDIKIVFSEPEIQASESVVHVKDVNDILHALRQSHLRYWQGPGMAVDTGFYFADF